MATNSERRRRLRKQRKAEHEDLVRSRRLWRSAFWFLLGVDALTVVIFGLRNWFDWEVVL